jgi:hypothetical protein
MTTGTEKYTCRIPEELNKVINRVSSSKNLNRNAALVYMVKLAVSKSEHKSANFSGNNSVNCTMQADKGFFESTLNYRKLHSLPNKKSVFFRNALERAASIFEEE